MASPGLGGYYQSSDREVRPPHRTRDRATGQTSQSYAL
jgi:hypothetical protein